MSQAYYRAPKYERLVTASAKKILPNNIEVVTRFDDLGNLEIRLHDSGQYIVAMVSQEELSIPRAAAAIDREMRGLRDELRKVSAS